jgi:hypothetical protein
MLAWLRRRRNIRRIGRWCGWIALALLALTVLSGYGISAFRIVEPLTLGLFGKAGSFRLHHYLDVPLVAFTLLHVGIGLWGRWGARRRTRGMERQVSAPCPEGEE